MRRWTACLFFCACVLSLSCACAQTYTAVLPVKYGTVEVHSTETAEGTWLFLPSFADLSSLSIRGMGEDYLLQPGEEEGTWIAQSSTHQVHIMKTQNLRALFLFSDDPSAKGREYIESSPSHTNEATGSIALVSEKGWVDYSGRLTQIRGRGNSTWGFEKKPYQIRLEDKYDLLNTGDSSERNRTWVLLADMIDASFLHNRIILDLCREMGLSDAGHCEHVDLYYDGEYRGLYLLTEKVEVGEGRTEGIDYDKLLKKWNKWIGQHDLTLLPSVAGQDAYGNAIRYVEGLTDNNVTNAGTYLLEMYGRGQSSAASGFTVNGDRAFALVNPEYASKDMVCHVSELLSDGLSALQNGGVHPKTGESVEKWFDLESFARAILINEFTRDGDRFRLTSTYFVLPAGETRFVAGPMWDHDRTMRNRNHYMEGGYSGGLRFYGNWAEEFYRIPSFMEHVKRILREELYPVVTQILLGSQRGRYLRPFEEYVQEIRPSALMNNKIWYVDYDISVHYGDSFDTDVDYLHTYIHEQIEWLYQVIVNNCESDADHINITMQVEYLYPQEPLIFTVFPWSKAKVVSFSHEQLTEADEENYALWHVELTLAPEDGFSFSQPQVWINDGRFTGEIQPDGTLLVEFQFEDLSYRPFEFEGEDIGLVFNPDVYAYNYPEVAKACGGDPVALAEHFCYEGMYEQYVGNGFFDPYLIMRYHPRLKDILGEDGSVYYWEFIYYGHELEEWMAPLDSYFVPPVHPCLDIE